MCNLKKHDQTRWFNPLFNNSHIGILIVNKKRTIIDVNPHFCTLFGYTQEEILNQSEEILHVNSQSYNEFFDIAFKQTINGIPTRLDYQFKHKDGTIFWCQISGNLVENEVLWGINDISQRISLAQQLQAKSQLLVATQTLLHIGTWELDLHTMMIKASDEFYTIMGLKIATEITLETYLQSLHPEDRHIIFASIAYLPKGVKTKGINLRAIIHRENYCEMRYIFQKGETIYDEHGKAIKLTGATVDVTDQKETEILLKSQKKRLEYQAFHDPLTGLPNRFLLLDRLNKMIDVAERKHHKIAILFIDLDDFKFINDSLGHHIGDKYLIAIATKIKDKLRSSDTIARIGGDEFVILLDDIHSENDIIKIIYQDIAIENEIFTLANETIVPQMSIGIALFPNDGRDAHTLLKNADAAMYKAKRKQKNSYSFYDTSLTQLAYNRMNFTKELREAIEKNEFLLYYQPQINAKTETLIGLEALIRWQHPTKGLLTPAQFLPLVEELGLLIELNEWVIKNAFKQSAQWHKSGRNYGQLSINMSIKYLESPLCYDFIKNILAQTQCHVKSIIFEITEGHFMQKPQEVIERLNQLCDSGFKIVVDDFGTGYSSLSYLSKLPISGLKIDKSFIDNIPYKNDDIAITKTIIELAKNLQLEVIAEGVEKEEQKNFLLSHGCDNIQGYLYSKPLSVHDVEAFMDHY
ncbi:MAG: EAL domain-containing protein [Sulfurospirillaceae bacterium]|nr:EAL domain-containing protein [Sulfurospirillaceae bacterium]MDD2826994.1 EAL domain-containing protein [Sulfurospirillaceae bacterium]